MTHRTALITAGSIAAVVFAGAIAVGVNLGILSFADSRPVGKLSASTGLPTSGMRVASEYTGANRSADSQNTQKYIIKKAGAVQIAFSKAGVRLVGVSARPHWKWALAQSADRSLTVTFRSGSTIYKFVAALGAQGTLVARVDQPVTKVVRTPTPARWVSAPVRSVATSARTIASTVRPAPAGGHESDNHKGSAADD